MKKTTWSISIEMTVNIVEKENTEQTQLSDAPFVEEETNVNYQASNTIKETCKILKLGRNTLMNLVNSGQLKSIKVGAKWLVPGWAIEEFLKVPKT